MLGGAALVALLSAPLAAGLAAERLDVPLPLARPPHLTAPGVPATAPRPTLEDPAAAPGPSGDAASRGEAVGPSACLAELGRMGVAFRPATVLADRDECRPKEPVTMVAVGEVEILRLDPPPVLECRMALATAVWLRESVLPAAAEILGRRPLSILAGPGHECRAQNRAPGAKLSEHATANAIDVMGFELSDRERVEVARHWGTDGPAGAFLARIRAEACRIFATVLGPGSDPAHADHFHLDLRARRAGGLCR